MDLHEDPRLGFLRTFGGAVVLILISTLQCWAGQQREAAQNLGSGQAQNMETLVMVRHGEVASGGLGQLDCEGLNRSLALPDVLLRRFGEPDYVFAPNPSEEIDEGGLHSYVRPLATIEPTAIRAGLPVNTQIGYTHIRDLQKELTKPEYANARIFVAWEHSELQLFAQHLIQAYGGDPSMVPEWQSSDYDTIYVFQLSQQDGELHLAFRLEQERLNGMLSDACPAGNALQQHETLR